MGLFKEIPPTAGFPIYASDLFSATKNGGLEEDLRNYLNLPYVRMTHSGTAALYLILETLKESSSKKTVVLPAFVCPSLVMAVVRAGLTVEVCDVQADRFDYDWNALENLCAANQDILAVVVVHLAGLPVDVRAVQKITKNRGIYLVEDCAQALGAELDGKKAGTFGDYSFFSLKRGKGLTIYEGGFVAASSRERGTAADRVFHRLVEKKPFSEFLITLGLLGYGIFYQPTLFWFVFKLRQNVWNRLKNPIRAMGEYFTVDFSTHEVSDYRKSVGHACFYRLEPEIAKQRKKAQFYGDHFKATDGFIIIEELPQSRATYPYRVLLFNDAVKWKKVYDALDCRGLGVSFIYVHAITDYTYLKPYLPPREFPNARRMAGRVMTLSTSSFLKDRDLDKIVSLLTKAMRG